MIKKIFILCVLFSSITSSKAQVIPNIDWKQYFGNTANPNFFNFPTTLDAWQNVYVTGYVYNGTDNDLVVLKYDSAGTLIYSYTYDNGGSDVGKAIVYDAVGNAYVCGRSWGAGTNTDYVVIKLNASGTMQYVFRWDGPVNGNDDAVDIKVDASGNAYVIGTTAEAGGGGNNDITTIKLNGTGSSQWIDTWDAGGSFYNDKGVALTLSANQNTVFITGNMGTGGSDDIAVKSLNATSATANWSTSATGNATGNDEVSGIIMTGTNVVITGKINNNTTGDDYSTITYNGSNGSSIWQTNYDYNNGTNRPTGLVRDSTGNVAVTGISMNGSTFEYHTVLYNTAGAQQWVNRESTQSTVSVVAPKVACDTIAHHFYVSGEKKQTSSDILIYQLTPSGNTSWIKTIDEVGSFDAAYNLAVNGIGEIYLASVTQNTASGYDITTIKIGQTPVYYPIDYNNANEAYSPRNYFYRNTGEILTATTTPQTATNVAYYTRHTYPQQFILKNNNVAFLMFKPDSFKAVNPKDSMHRVDLEFFHSNALTEAYHFETQEDGILNYFLGQLDREIVDVKGNKRIMIPNIYPYTDLHFYSNNKGLKMYLVVKPGASPSVPILQFNGASSTTLTGTNQLKINTALGSFAFETPQVYWVDNNLNTYSVTGSWNSLGSNKYSINTGTYNVAWPLVIQINQGMAAAISTIQGAPWSTYWGGSGLDKIMKSKTDPNNNLWVCGTTSSPNFPGVGVGVFSVQAGSSPDGFISKFGPLAGNLYFSTYVGGTKRDQVNSLDFGFGGAYCVGITTSSNAPVKANVYSGSAYNNSVFVGPLSLSQGDKDDGFIFLLGPNGNANNWYTYYGGNGFDYLAGCDFDSQGNFFVVGQSTSTNIAVQGSSPTYTQVYNTSQQVQTGNGHVWDGIIMKFAANSSAPLWRTYYGTHLNTGTSKVSDDELLDVAFDSNDNVYIAGKSGGISLPGALNSPFTTSNTDGIVAKFTNTGTLVASRYTNKNECNNAVCVFNNKVHLAGWSSSTLSAVNSGNYYHSNTINNGGSPGGYEASLIITDFSLNVVHTTLLGGNNDERATSITTGTNGIFYIAGGTNSSNFPTSFPANSYTSNQAGGFDYFITAMAEGTTGLIWSTYLGSSTTESDFGTAASLAYDSNNYLHICGVTTSSVGYPFGLPYQGAWAFGTSAGNADGTITRLDLTNVVIGIKEHEKERKLLMLFPNPTDNSLSFVIADADNKPVFYSVYNMVGQKVREGSLLTNERSINVSSLPNGAYFVNFNTGLKTYTGKFIKVN